MTPAAAAKAEQALKLSAAFERIMDLPTQAFPDIQRPTPLRPPEIDEAAIRRAHHVIAKQGIRLWNREGRKRARVKADVEAFAEVSRLRQEYADRSAEWQADLDRAWDALGDNDPDVVLATLAAAFEDNEAPAAAVGVTGDEVSIVVVVPRVVDVVPERKPSTTAAGNLSLKKLTKRDTAYTYSLVVCGHVLATVKECFAVARGAQAARVVAVRPSGIDAYGQSMPEAILAANIRRNRLVGIQWASTDAATILNQCNSELHLRQKGVAKEWQPLELDAYPDVQAALRAVDFNVRTEAGAQEAKL